MMSGLHDDWQVVDDIIKSNAAMLEKQLACDVTFTLGEKGDVIGAHKFILISRSPVFDVMFSGPLNGATDLKEISLPDIEMEPFKCFLQYLYTGETTITVENVIPVLYTAKKYSVSGLSQKCLAFVENNMDAQNACAVLEQAHFFDETDFQGKVLQVILRKAEEVLMTEDVRHLCVKCLSMIVSSDNLIADEAVVFRACKQWAESECKRRDLSVTDANCRIMLGSTLYQIRFPHMESSIFVKELASSQLLTDEEKVDVMSKYIIPARPSEFFSSVPRRKNQHHKFNRFKKRSHVAFNNKSGCSAVAFKTSRDITLEGFTIYGPCKPGEHEVKVSALVVDANDDTVSCCTDKTITANPDTDIYEILFDESCRLQRASGYIIKVDISGPHTFAGEDGRLTAFVGDTIFTFSNSDSSLTGTTVGKGQIPGLVFSV